MSRPKVVIPDNEKIKVPTDWSPEMRLQTWKFMARYKNAWIKYLV